MARKLTVMKPSLALLDTRIAKPPPKRVDAHYQTPEHRAWRAEVIRRAGGLCQGRQCKGHEPGARLFADHIVELRDGGEPFDAANGQALCGACHTAKTARSRAQRMAARP